MILLAALLLAPALPAIAGAGATEPEVEAQRRTFSEARAALRAGRTTEFRRLSGQLESYVLYPYLQYDLLRRDLSRAQPLEVAAFLEKYDDTPLEPRLRGAWLERLARQGRWEDYRRFYRPGLGDGHDCHALVARLRLGERDSLWPDVERMWTAGESRPKACDPAFNAWMAAGKRTREATVRRIELAMARSQLSLVTYLSGLLPKTDQAWVRRWQSVHRNPAHELAGLKADGEWAARLFTHGIVRLARRDPAAADLLWQKRRGAFGLSGEQVLRGERAIALNLATDHLPGAASRFSTLTEHDAVTRAWWVRAALRSLDWDGVLTALAAMPLEERALPDWSYWEGRALEAVGRTDEADVLFRRAAECRCYYGFLAAERAGLPAPIESVPLAVDEAALKKMITRPALMRARELHALDLGLEARREWRDAVAAMGPEELRVAAKLADTWGWHHQAILTLGRTEWLDDLELRFPTPFHEQITAAAEQVELDTAFIYAVMRQESAFYPAARSHAGALGLMQLMPATARNTARQLKQRVRNSYEILAVDRNIELGTAHLRHLMDEYKDNRLYTMAAYNAGPHRVKRWQSAQPLPGDVWVATLPFGETREYIKRILAYTMIYEWRLGLEPTPLSHYLASSDFAELRVSAR